MKNKVVAKRPGVGGYTIFCDDIREEIGGKVTYVGVMHAGIGVENFPAVFPKLGLAVTYREAREAASIPMELAVVLEQDDANVEVVRVPIDLAAAEAAAEAASNGPLKGAYILAMVNIVISPLQVSRPSVLRVRAEGGGREVRLGALQINQSEHLPAVLSLDSGSGSVKVAS